MTLSAEELDPDSELRRKARANVATFEPLTGEELAEISRLFAGTHVPAAVIGGQRSGASGGARTPAAPVSPPAAGVAGPRSSGRRGVPSRAGRAATNS